MKQIRDYRLLVHMPLRQIRSDYLSSVKYIASRAGFQLPPDRELATKIEDEFWRKALLSNLVFSLSGNIEALKYAMYHWADDSDLSAVLGGSSRGSRRGRVFPKLRSVTFSNTTAAALALDLTTMTDVLRLAPNIQQIALSGYFGVQADDDYHALLGRFADSAGTAPKLRVFLLELCWIVNADECPFLDELLRRAPNLHRFGF